MLFRSGKENSHEGNYEDYLRWKELAAGSPSVETAAKSRQAEVVAPAANDSAGSANGNVGGEPEATGKDRPRRLNPIKQKQMEERCVFLEEEIPRIEASIAHTEEQLGVYVSAAETQRLSDLAEQLRSQLVAFTAEWEELMTQLESA